MNTAVSTAAHCRHCQAENPPQRKFCGGCGKGLWGKCPACSAEIAGNERFCGTCGTDVGGKRQELAAELREKLTQVEGVSSIESSFSLGQVKHSRVLPL